MKKDSTVTAGTEADFQTAQAGPSVWTWETESVITAFWMRQVT